MMRLRRTENGRDVAADVDGMGEDNRNIVRDRGGAPTFPTVQWLAGFPDEREAVLEYLRGGLPESPYRELILLASIGAVFERGEPLVPRTCACAWPRSWSACRI